MRTLLLAACAALAAGCQGAPRRDGGDPARAASLAAIGVAEDRRDGSSVRVHLASLDPVVRARAARAAGRLRDGTFVPDLSPLASGAGSASDPDIEVAQEAVFAIGLLGPDGALGVLRALLASRDAALRAVAAEALGRASSDRVALDVLPALSDDTPAVRAQAALALFRLAGDRFAGTKELAAEERLRVVEALASASGAEGESDVRWRVVYALASLRDPRARPALIDALRDQDPFARLFAARGLGALPADALTSAALASAAPDPDDRVACEVATAIGRRPSAGGAAVLTALLDREAAFVRRAAVRAMGFQAGDAGTVAPSLERATRDVSPSVRAEVALAAARLRAPEVATFLDERLGDENALVRARAAEAAGLLEADAALPRLERALRDPDHRVAAAAATALGSVADARGQGLLRRSLLHPRGLVRENAAEALRALTKAGITPSVDDVRTLLDSIAGAGTEDLAEARASLLEALSDLELARKLAPLGRNGAAATSPEEAGLRARIVLVLMECLGEADPTVRANAQAAWRALLPEEPIPVVAGKAAREPAIPGATLAPFDSSPRVRVRTTRGDFEMELFGDDAPVHAENFLRLAAAGAYDGTPFHRVELNFVLQGGDHLGDGTGARAASGGLLRDEINRRPFLRGTVGMPKSAVPDSGGSQIFVCHVPTPHLDGRYTAFGQVLSGWDAIDAIEVGDSILGVDVLDPGR